MSLKVFWGADGKISRAEHFYAHTGVAMVAYAGLATLLAVAPCEERRREQPDTKLDPMELNPIAKAFRKKMGLRF